MIFNLICVLVALLISYHIFLKQKIIFLCFLPFTIQYLWMFASILVIEQDAYINEQDRYGEFIYANFYLLLFFISSILSFVIFFAIFKKSFRLDLPRFKFLGKTELFIVLFIAIVVTIVAYFSLLTSPSVYTSDKITKFNYWDSAAFPRLNIILGNTIGYLPFIFGLIFSRYKKTTILLIVLYLIYLVGVDQKFTAFLYGFIGFLLSFAVMNYQDTTSFSLLKIRKRYLGVVGILVFSLVLIKYSNKNPFAHLNLTPVESVFYRAFGLQAHVFWGATEKYVHNNEPKTWDVSELPYGMHVLMKDFTAPSQQKYLKLLWNRNVSWTNAYPAILIRIFPIPIAILFHFLIFSIVPLLYVLLIKTILSRNFLFAIILFQLTLWMTNIYSMAYFYRLTKVAFIFIALVFFTYIYQKAKENI